MTTNMQSLLPRIEQSIREHNFGWPQADFRKYAEDMISIKRVEEQWERIWEISGAQFIAGQQVLELGSGFGTFLWYAEKQGLHSFGLEPDGKRALISRDLLAGESSRNAYVFQGVGEVLPIKNDTFDYIYSANVLEHVNDPQKVIHELIRILKPNGVLQIVIPNYGSWWEGHYGLIWPPNIPKPFAKLYVRIFGRDPDQLDELCFVNRRELEQIIWEHKDEIDVLSWGQKIWENRVRTLNFSTWGALTRLDFILRVIHRIGLVEFVIWLGRKLHWETPLIFTARKRANSKQRRVMT